MQVQEVMARAVFTSGVEEPLSAPARLMWERDIGSVPIIGADGKLAGVITDRDICMAALFTGEPLCAMPTAEHMSRQVFTARRDQSVESAEQLMREKQIRRLPVVDDTGAVVGMLALGDIARAAAARGRKAIGVDELAATLAAVSQPRAVGARATA